MIGFDLVIPHYGEQSMLARALASVLAQDCQPRTIIVVDDGSPQPVSLPAVDPNRIRLIRHEDNRGAAAARRTGILSATSEWLTFLDSDDELLPASLAARASLIARDQECQAAPHVAYACAWQERDRTGQLLRTRQPRPAAAAGDFFSGCWFSPGSCLFINRGFVLGGDCLPDARLRLLEDFDWFARLGQRGLVLKVLPVVGAMIEIRRDHDARRLTEAADALRARWRSDANAQEWRKLNAYLELELAATAHWQGRHGAAIQHMLASLAAVPRLSVHLSPGCEDIPAPPSLS